MNNPNITKVYLLDVPLENDYKNTLYFTSKASQQSYFENNIIKSYTDFSYQRKDKIIRIPDIYDNICNCNYVMYQNTAYSNKWFYAFITKMEYINDDRTDVYIETDVIQTWLFDYEVKSSFVEREHVSDDTIGNNTVPEGLETGEYVINNTYADTWNTDLTCVVGSTVSPGELASFYGGNYTGIPSGIAYYRFNQITGETNSLLSFLKLLDQNSKADAVVGIFLAPKWLCGGDTTNIPITNSDQVEYRMFNVVKLNNLNGYVPRNNKLLTYPYIYTNLSNSQGGNTVIHQELWSNNENNASTIMIAGCLTPGCSIRAYPYNYKGIQNPYDEGINLGKFPQLNWTTDQYTNWLTQNGINIATSITGSTIETVASGVTGNALGVAHGLLGITNTLGEVYKHSLVPPQARGNTNSGDVTTASGFNKFIAYNMSIKQEYARIIDGYFDMFGYKVNRVKVPNTNHRSRWWYIKTIDVNIDGDIDNNDMQKIKNAYNNGITFWRNASEIQNYSLSNDIV